MGDAGVTDSTSALNDKDAWLHSAFGIKVSDHVGQPAGAPVAAPPPPAAAPPGPSSGLAPAGSSQQSQAFRDAMQQQLAAIDRNLAYTASNAEDAKHQPMAAKRETLIKTYEVTLKQIDPEAPDKAKGSIDKVVAAAQAVAAQIAQFRGEVEKAFNDWKGREPRFAEAGDHVTELQDWRSPEAAGFAKDVETIGGQVKNRQYKEASAGCEKLLAALGPVVKAMRDQKAAMARYEPALKELQPRLEEARQCQFAKLAPFLQELGTIQTQMTGAADAHDYVKAEPMLADLKTKVDLCIKMRDELAAKKDAYDKAYAALQPRIPNTSEPGGERIVALQQEIATKVPEMDGKAKAEDYDAALALAQELDGKITELDTALAARKHYDEQLSALTKDRVPQPPTNAAPLKDLEAKITSLMQQAESEAAKDDYEPACAHLTTLASTLAEYDVAVTKFNEQKQAYEQAKAALEERLPKASAAAEGRLAEVQNDIDKSLADAKAAADAEDYGTALEHMRTLEQQLDEFEKLLAARDEYEAKRKEIEAHLPPTDQKAAGALADVLKQIEDLRSEAETAAKASDYETAMNDLNQIEPLLPKYQDLANLRDQFDKRWAEVQPDVPTATDPKASPKMLEIGDKIGQSRNAIDAVATNGDYEGGMTEIDKVVKLLADLKETQEKEAQARANFEQEYATLKQSVEPALAAQTDVPEVKAKQDELAAKKKTLDDTVAKNDFETAKAQLAELRSALDAYHEEATKSPVNKNLVRDIASRLTTSILQHYMNSQAKVNNAASAYDAALADHKGAIAKVSEKKQLAADIAAGVFFAALGGFAGGAVGNATKSQMQKAFADSAAGGGIVDATKDVAKYLTRTADKARGKISDPTAISAKCGGNGTELARSVGAAVNQQGSKLLEVVKQWQDVLIESDKADPNADSVRINLDGDPSKSVDNDPFLKILDGICGTKIDFARALWASWIDDYAYTIDDKCNEWGDCTAVVKDEVESFFAQWADLTKNIEQQAGQDFGLRGRLDAAKKSVQAKADAKNAENFFTR